MSVVFEHATLLDCTGRDPQPDSRVVVDDGRGFVVSERNNLPGHLGLLAVKERALMAGGWYKIESQPGLGTRIEFWMPIV